MRLRGPTLAAVSTVALALGVAGRAVVDALVGGTRALEVGDRLRVLGGVRGLAVGADALVCQIGLYYS